MESLFVPGARKPCEAHRCTSLSWAVPAAVAGARGDVDSGCLSIAVIIEKLCFNSRRMALAIAVDESGVNAGGQTSPSQIGTDSFETGRGHSFFSGQAIEARSDHARGAWNPT